jgi:hypothetical protein
MRNINEAKLIPIFAVLVSLFAGSLIADSTSGQDDPMSQAPKPIPRSKDAYGSVSSSAPSPQKMPQEEASLQTTPSSKDMLKKKAIESGSSKKLTPESIETRQSQMMKPIPINPNPPGTPSSSEVKEINEVEDPMANHKESRFMLDNDNTVKIKDGVTDEPKTIGDPQDNKSWW